MRLFHGTTFKAKQSILKRGINLSHLQERDFGFFGKGFYATTKRHGAKMYGQSIVNLTTKPTAKILKVPSGAGASWVPTINPSWQRNMVVWFKRKVMTNPDLTPQQRKSVLPKAIAMMTPESPRFDKHYWKNTVSQFAKDTGIDIVHFAGGSEVVILNPKSVNILPNGKPQRL